VDQILHVFVLQEHFPAKATDHSYDNVYQVRKTIELFFFIAYFSNFYFAIVGAATQWSNKLACNSMHVAEISSILKVVTFKFPTKLKFGEAV
jgi:hypothetical protein